MKDTDKALDYSWWNDIENLANNAPINFPIHKEEKEPHILNININILEISYIFSIIDSILQYTCIYIISTVFHRIKTVFFSSSRTSDKSQ